MTIPPPHSSQRPPLDSMEEEQLPRQFGKYTLLEALAKGGMAKVYLAIQRAVAGFEKMVVIKRIRPELSRDPAFVDMLLSEARTAATLNHPNVVQTFDVGEVEQTYFIAMEYINGEDIRSIVRAMKRAEVREFPLEHTLHMIVGLCAGLAYAHDKRDLDGRPIGIVHRDISPQNVLVTFSGDVKIVDFGIAKTHELAASEATGVGTLKGKVPYMSPEQAAGEDLDHRSDIFAVGIMLFELSTGRRLFKGGSEYETLKLICERDYPVPSQIRPDYPPELEAIVMRALARNRDERYSSAREMQADLEDFIRENRIAVSTVKMGEWMKMLFRDKIAQQKETLQDVKQIADVIASQRVIDTGYGHATTNGAATISGTDISAFPPANGQKSRTGLYVFMAAVAVVACGLVFAVMTGRLGEPTATSAAGSAALPTGSAETAPQRAVLRLGSDPSGAYVRIAGELQSNKTPLEIDRLPLGVEIEIKVSKDGYEDHTEKVTLSADDLAPSVNVTLHRGSVSLKWTVVPKHAVVVIDGKKFKGGGNAVDDFSAGKHTIMFVASGYMPKVFKETFKKGDSRDYKVALVRDTRPVAARSATATKPTTPEPASGGTGTVSVNSKGGWCTNVIVGGRSVGPTPVGGIPVAAGPVSILCKTADGRTVGSGTRVVAGKKARVTIVIPPK